MPSNVQIGGVQYAIVPSSSLVVPPYTQGEAAALLRGIIGPQTGRLREWIDEHGLMPLGPEPPDLIEFAALLLCRGALVLIREPVDARLLDTPTIADLIGVPEPTRGDGRRPQAPADQARQTWVSFEVVDDHGTAVDGAFRCSMAGNSEAGELQRRHHRYDPVRHGSSAQLYLEGVRRPTLPPVPLPPRAPADPREPGDSPQAPTFVSFEVVDDAGVPWEGDAALDSDERVALSATHRVAASGASVPLRLQLRRSSAGVANIHR